MGLTRRNDDESEQACQPYAPRYLKIITTTYAIRAIGSTVLKLGGRPQR
jgi:hypothetical protein